MERGVLVESILRQNSTQLRFTKNDYMVDALAPDRSDQPFQRRRSAKARLGRWAYHGYRKPVCTENQILQYW